ncbi:MAG: permease, partial [Deltaproteobacteria bacterium]|nr:permease [Deltaproteobacteria bacterium]
SMAFARVASAIILGILCGVIVDLLERKGVLLEETVQDVIGKSGIKGKATHAVPANPHTKESEKERKRENRLHEAFSLMWMSAKYPGRYFLIAIVLSAVVATYVPGDAFVRYMGTGHTSIVIAAIMGIPLYMCGGGAIPLVQSFLCMGMDNGAALTFLVVGPATRIAPMVTVFSLVRKRIFLVYFLVVLLGGMVLGFLYGLL